MSERNPDSGPGETEFTITLHETDYLYWTDCDGQEIRYYHVPFGAGRVNMPVSEYQRRLNESLLAHPTRWPAPRRARG